MVHYSSFAGQRILRSGRQKTTKDPSVLAPDCDSLSGFRYLHAKSFGATRDVLGFLSDLGACAFIWGNYGEEAACRPEEDCGCQQKEESGEEAVFK